MSEGCSVESTWTWSTYTNIAVLFCSGRGNVSYTKRLIRKWVKLDTLVSYQIRLYNIISLFYLFPDRIYYQINNFIFYVFISWPLHEVITSKILRFLWIDVKSRIWTWTTSNPRIFFQMSEGCSVESIQIRLYNIISLFYLFPDRIYYQINNFIFYVFISWPLHRKLKRWATRIPPKPGDEPRSTSNPRIFFQMSEGCSVESIWAWSTYTNIAVLFCSGRGNVSYISHTASVL
jgi:hypothetical protein